LQPGLSRLVLLSYISTAPNPRAATASERLRASAANGSTQIAVRAFQGSSWEDGRVTIWILMK
jgi:hypothetical protein